LLIAKSEVYLNKLHFKSYNM